MMFVEPRVEFRESDVQTIKGKCSTFFIGDILIDFDVCTYYQGSGYFWQLSADIIFLLNLNPKIMLSAAVD